MDPEGIQKTIILVFIIVLMLLLESDIFQPIRQNIFLLGGLVPMSVVTLLLVALVFEPEMFLDPICLQHYRLYRLLDLTHCHDVPQIDPA